MADQITVEELEALVADNSKATLEELVEASVRVFSLLAEAIKNPEAPDSKHLLDLVQKLKTKLETEAQSALQSAGMTEEDLKVFLEDPNNFSPQEWEQLQSMRGEMNKASQQFMQNAMGTAFGGASPALPAPGKEQQKPSAQKGGAQRPGGRRDNDWLAP
ncbi:MAG: hypothetical protein ACOYKZ_03260 [Chlamydiia bacterium]